MSDNDKDYPEQRAADVIGDAGARLRTDAGAAADAPPGVSRGQRETGQNSAAADTTTDIIAACGSPEAAESTVQHDLLTAAPSEGTGVTGNVHANDAQRSPWLGIARLFSRSTWRGK